MINQLKIAFMRCQRGPDDKSLSVSEGTFSHRLTDIRLQDNFLLSGADSNFAHLPLG